MTPAPTSNGQDEGLQQTPPPARVPHWLTRQHGAVSGGLGVVMLVLAVVAPLVSPVEQRGEVLIITVLFGLAGSLMLYTAVNSRRDRPISPARQASALVGGELQGNESARALLLKRHDKNSRNRKLAGFIFGLFFGLAGMIAPFVLSEGSDNPDARFLMIIGFSPVAISGALMVILFGQTLLAGAGAALRESNPAIPVVAGSEPKAESITASMATVAVASGVVLSACAVILPLISTGAMRNGIGVPAAVMGALGMAMSLIGGGLIRRESGTNTQENLAISAQPKARRAPVARIPTTTLYKIVVPAAIVVLLVLIVAVIVVVIAATVTPLVR